MDKNTITGMLLMCAVIFGYMYFFGPSEAEMAEQQRQQDSIAAVQQAAKAATPATAIDVLNADEVTQIKNLLTGMAGDSLHSGTIDRDGVHIHLDQGSLAGTIALADTTFAFDEALSATSPVPAKHNQAVAAVRKAVESYLKNGSFANCLTGTEQIVKLENDSLRLELSTKGGTISRAQLKAYKAFNAPMVEVFTPGENDYSFTLCNNTQRFETRDFYFTPERVSDSCVVMRLNLDGGATWALRYTLVPGSYMVRMEMVQNAMQSVIPININSVDLTWHQKMARHEEGKMFEERNSAIYYKYYGQGGDVEYTKESGNDEKDVRDKIKWISTKNQFFSAVLIADSLFNGAQLTSREFEKGSAEYQNYLKDMTIRTSLPYASDKTNPAAFYFYLGPNRYPTLSALDCYSPNEDLKLTRLIPLGWKLFRWINTGVIIPVFTWLGKFIGNYGIIILILTILLKIVLSPLTFKSYMSQAKMRILAPDIAAINEQYPDQEDAMKRQQKTMELYSLAGASPFGGCLPMLLQMPILIAMFTFFPSCIELRGQAFLWAKDLSAPDKIFEWTAQIPFITNYFGNHISLFCLLMTVTNIGYTYLTMQSQNQQQSMPGMKWMMYLMPLMFLVFFNNYASGLSYYYFISLLITIAQTYLCRAFVSEDKVRATIAANRDKPKKKSGFMARLEEAQRQQQAMLREQEKRKGAKGKGRR
ncbi:MAG: membrane protein insertase YidC [Muribaculaceae bacterium]|nr:membrane protein insertase YidC [Muribaculaceae bacterium]